MPTLRVVFLWHQHQPFYKDLVTGEYRLPWVRLHALKDYYGMVKLLEEFPGVHQTFNLVPSLIAQIEDYVAGTAHDPFLAVAAKPAQELSREERRFALEYLFQSNPTQMIGRYPRYAELWERYRGAGANPERAEQFFSPQDFTDLQVLSQLAWFDEYFLEEPEIAGLVKKGRHFSPDEQGFVIAKEREIMAAVLPAHRVAAEAGRIEISTSPFYHPILPLLCNTDQGAVSCPGLKLPEPAFRCPEDAGEQLKRGLALHERVFGRRPRGVWPSEGSVSEEVFAIAHELGVQWMATDEGVLGHTLGFAFEREGGGRLRGGGPERLYTPYLYEKDGSEMRLFFRDHALSDLIGFVYSGMPAKEAAAHFLRSLKESAQPVLRQGKDAVVTIILDGENAWEYYPKSGREFLRRVYDALGREPGIEAVTCSQALERQRDLPRLRGITPGSWINANFNVWIGAPEDNRAWDFLASARAFYTQAAPAASPEKRALAFEEVLIAEGSDWNWWYGPEHHSANDRDFDELYRKHLSNIYQTLGAEPPVHLAQTIITGAARLMVMPQTAYIRPRVTADLTRYFDWLGAASYTADRHAGAMHGKLFLLDAIYAGIDEKNLYGRLDFAGSVPEERLELVVRCDVLPREKEPSQAMRLEAWTEPRGGKWLLRRVDSEEALATPERANGVRVAVDKNFEFQVPLGLLQAAPGDRLRLRFSLWRDHLPLDALPLEGALELQVVPEEGLEADTYNYSPAS
jgi:alpha-amylase/alpha-mannosidase (GH57 family)